MPEKSAWIPVGALGEAFGPDANLLPGTQRLAGTSMTLHLEDGSTSSLQFLDEARLNWRGSPHGFSAPAPYRATEIRPGIVCLSVVHPDRAGFAVVAVLDLSRGICTVVLGSLPSRGEANEPLLSRIERGRDLTSVSAMILPGAIDTPLTAETDRHAKTGDLIGKRVEYTYSPTERYEHIYLNERLYTWHCVSGSEQGLADTDSCDYRKIANDLYLFVWREKVVPTLGVVLVDLEQLKTTGLILGYEGFDFAAVTSFPVGARARVLRNS
jgi:MoaF C-terminal domain/MoaF N-terminal domain